MKSAKNLLIPFVVMILLALGVVVFLVVDKAVKNKPAVTTGTTVDLLYISPVDIASISVRNREGNSEIKVDRSQSADGTAVYKYSGSDKGSVVYSQNHMAKFIMTMNSFVGCESVTENGVLSEYGLDNPAFTVTITKNDGTKAVIFIGNLSPDDGKCYVCAEGSTSVYLSDRNKYDTASKNGNDFIDDRILNISVKDIDSVLFYRKSDSVELNGTSIYNDDDDSLAFKFNKPFSIESSTYFNRLIENICVLSATGYEDATNQNLSKYNLAIPQYKVALTLRNGVTYSVEFSSVSGGVYYGRLNGVGKIFKVDASVLALIESPLLSLISENVFYESCDKVDSVECTGRDRNFVLKLDVKKDQAISDYDSSVSLDGRNAKVSSESGRSYAAMLYEAIFSIRIGGIEESYVVPENAVADTSIKIYDRNHSAVVYDFYRRNDESFYVVKDGRYTGFYVFKRELYNDGGKDTYDYGIWPAYEILTKAITNSINGVYEIPEKQ